MDDTAKRRVDELTERAISEGPFEDFRNAYRTRLRWLKENQARAFPEALAHYNEILVPNIAGGNEPLREWLDYGRRLGQLSGVGKAVSIDETGKSRPLSDDVRGLILYLPEDTAVPALPLAIPRDMSDAQRATFDLLVPRRQSTFE